MRLISLVTLVLLAAPSIAQWDLNPQDPSLVCSEESAQTSPQSYPDGQGGLFVFWLDDRESAASKDVYGQHYNSQGEKLWEAEGREILNIAENIPYYRFARYADGKMLLVWYANTDPVVQSDGIYGREIDEEGNALWEEDLHLAEENTMGAMSVGYFSHLLLHRIDDVFVIQMQINTYGYNRIRIVSFNLEQELQPELITPFNGVEIGPLDVGVALSTTDGESGIYVYYSTGNGLGAALMVNRVSPSGTLLWPQWINATMDSPGLGYQFGAIGDPDGVTLFWEINQADIIARRLDGSGQFNWPEAIGVCTAPGTQNAFRAGKINDEYYIIWRDARPGVNGTYAVYGQRMDTAGNIFWAENGIEIANIGSNDPLAVFSFTDDNSITVMHRTSNGIVQERVQKVLQDGSLDYDPEGLLIAEGPTLVTSDTQKQLILSENKIIAVWRSLAPGTGENIHISLVETLVTYTSETLTACNFYSYQGELLTESGTYVFELPENTIHTIYLTIEEFLPSIALTDSSLIAWPSEATYSWVDCDTGLNLSDSQEYEPETSGQYAVTVSTDLCSVTTDCIFFPVYTYIDTTIFACESFNFDGVVLTESGIYNLTLPGEVIWNLNLVIESLEVSIENSGNQLIALPSDADQWSWIDCDNGAEIGTDSILEITSSGNYACTVTQGSCSVLSDCLFVEYTGIEEYREGDVKIYPNPTDEILNVTFSKGNEPTELMIRDSSGRLIHSERETGGMSQIPVKQFPPGIYFLQLRNPKGTITKKWVKL